METINQQQDEFENILETHQKFLSEIQFLYIVRSGIYYFVSISIALSIVFFVSKILPSSSYILNFFSVGTFVLTVLVSLVTLIGEKFSYPAPIFDIPFVEDVTIHSLRMFPIGNSLHQQTQTIFGESLVPKRLAKVYMNYCRYILVSSSFGISLLIAQVYSQLFTPSALLNIASTLLGGYFVYKNYPSQHRIEEIYVNYFRAKIRFGNIFSGKTKNS
jgi:hypothetical protein